MSAIVFQEWRNNNAGVKYPFADNATLLSKEKYQLQNSLFVDARLYPMGTNGSCYLSSIMFSGDTIIFNVSDNSNTNIASGSYTIASGADTVRLVDSYGRPAGVLVSSNSELETLTSSLGTNTVTFTSTSTPFDSSTVLPIPTNGVEGILLSDGYLATGTVWMVGTDGIVLNYDQNRVKVNVIGNPYAIQAVCRQNGLTPPAFVGVKTINGIKPDANGDFKFLLGKELAANSIIRLQPAEDQINLQIGTVLSGRGCNSN